MKKLILFFPFIAVLALSSCEKLLDEDLPQTSDVQISEAIKNVSDVRKVLSTSFDAAKNSTTLSGNMQIGAEIMAGDFTIDESRLAPFGTQDVYLFQTTLQINFLRDMWADAYSCINRANVVIGAFDNNLISGAEADAAKDSLQADAYFLRAYMTFEITRLWGQAYNVNSSGANAQLGTVLRTEASGIDPTAFGKARSTVEECYAQILSDLNKATTLYENKGIIKSASRGSKMAALALSARVNFQKGDYSLAATQAAEVINNGGYTLVGNLSNANPSPFNAEGFDVSSTETIFQFCGTPSNAIPNDLKSNYARNNLFYLTEAQATTLYPDGSNDLRFADLLQRSNVGGTFRYNTKKYFANASGQNPNRVLIRLAEMYLTFAEAKLESGASGSDTDVLNAYNAVRLRAIPSATAVNSVTLEDVRAERRRELLAEIGDHFHNLKRMQQNLRAGTAWNASGSVYQIPQEEMSGNPLCVQNP